jgi:glutamate synthase domain-containing protein 3
MKNGTIIVGGDAGFMTGLYMMGGKIIVLGDMEEGAGESMIGGKIFFGGKAKSFGKNVQVGNPTAEEIEEIKKLFSKYKINSEPKKFKKLTPKKDRPVYG